MTVHVPPRDPRIHVFALAEDGALRLAHQTYLSRLSEPADATPLTDAFGLPIDSTYAEVFAVRDIAPMTLREYLVQAHDILPETLDGAAERLDGIKGDLVVLAPKSLPAGGTLVPHGDLIHLGSFAPAEANRTPVKLPPAAREPSVAIPAPAVASGPSRRAIAWVLAGGFALMVAFVIML